MRNVFTPRYSISDIGIALGIPCEQIDAWIDANLIESTIVAKIRRKVSKELSIFDAYKMHIFNNMLETGFSTIRACEIVERFSSIYTSTEYPRPYYMEIDTTDDDLDYVGDYILVSIKRHVEKCNCMLKIFDDEANNA